MLTVFVMCWSYILCVFFSGMDIVNEALETAMNGRDKNDWTPVFVNVAPATLTILSRQVLENSLNMTEQWIKVSDWLSSSLVLFWVVISMFKMCDEVIISDNPKPNSILWE